MFNFSGGEKAESRQPARLQRALHKFETSYSHKFVSVTYFTLPGLDAYEVPLPVH